MWNANNLIKNFNLAVSTYYVDNHVSWNNSNNFFYLISKLLSHSFDQNILPFNDHQWLQMDLEINFTKSTQYPYHLIFLFDHKSQAKIHTLQHNNTYKIHLLSVIGLTFSCSKIVEKYTLFLVIVVSLNNKIRINYC